MFVLSSQVDYSNHHKSSVGGLVGYGNSNSNSNHGPYYQDQQQKSSTERDHITNRMYFGEQLLDESNKSESVQDGSTGSSLFYGSEIIYVYIKIHARNLHLL